MSAFAQVTVQGDEQDFHFPGPAEVRLRHARHTCAIAGTTFGMIAKSAANLIAPAVAMLVVLLMGALMALRGVPLLSRTVHLLTVLTPVADNPRLPWVQSELDSRNLAAVS
jgi:hypothetical protein